MKIEKDVIRKNSTRIDHYHRAGDKVVVRRNQAYKYETPFQGLYEIVQVWKKRNCFYTNGHSHIQNKYTPHKTL